MYFIRRRLPSRSVARQFKSMKSRATGVVALSAGTAALALFLIHRHQNSNQQPASAATQYTPMQLCCCDAASDDDDTFFRAVQHGDIARVRALLASGSASPNATDRATLQCALHLVALTGNEEMAVLLLDEFSAGPEVRDQNGSTPLYVAALSGQIGIARRLLKHGASVSAANAKGRTPLFAACWRGHLAIAELLHEHGASVAIADSEGITPSAIAREWAHDACAEWCDKIQAAGGLSSDVRA